MGTKSNLNCGTRPGLILMALFRSPLALAFFTMTCAGWTQSLRSSGPPDQLLLEAQQLIKQGNLGEARKQLSRAIELHPRQASLYNFMGVIDAQENKYHQAEAQFRKAISLNPQYEGPYVNLGRLYQEHQLDDPQALHKALEVYDVLLKLNPGHEEGHYQTAVLLSKQNDYKASLDHISALPEAAQSTPHVLSIRCGDLAALGQPLQAEMVARRLSSLPDFSEADVISILPLLEMKKADSLEVLLLEELSRKNLASPASLHQLGLAYERQENFGQARAVLETVAQRQKIGSDLLLELARIAYRQKDNKGALGYLAHARDLDPKNPAIYFFWGIVCMEEELPLEALKALREAVDLAPDNAYAHYALGEVILNTRYPDEAIAHFKKFCLLRPKDPQGQYALGVAYYASGQYSQARQQMEALATNSLTAAGANFYLARLERQEGNFDDALRRIELAMKAYDQYADAYSELGQIQMRRRELGLAEKAFQRSIEIDPDNYLANLNLMVVYQRTNDPRQKAQTERFEEVKKKRSEREQLFLRKIEIQPY